MPMLADAVCGALIAAPIEAKQPKRDNARRDFKTLAFTFPPSSPEASVDRGGDKKVLEQPMYQHDLGRK